MARKLFFRNVRARDQLEIFLLSAISSVLVIRLFLHLTGYISLGGGDYHIAHMLYGGFMMLAAVSLPLTFLGARVLRVSAIVGGVGFGFFIDELGKFITSDNDYFFNPTVGLIYAIFISLYLMFNFLSRTEKLSSREYQLNALAQLEEAIIHDMDPFEKQRVADLLDRASQKSPFTGILRDFLNQVQTVPGDEPRMIRRVLAKISSEYRRFWHLRSSHALVRAFFIVEAGLFLLAVLISVYHNIDQVVDVVIGNTRLYSSQLLVGQLASTILAAGYAVAGVLLLRTSRTRAFEQFRRATMINLFLTQFFIFSRIQFGALPGFFFNLVLLGLINYAIYQEKAGRARHEA